MDFFKRSPLWNNENKSCLNDIKFWEVSGNLKTNQFWKLQLSISCGTQKSAKIPRHVAKMIRPFWIYDTYKINFQVKYYFVSLQDYNTKTDFSILFCNWTKKHEIEKFCFWKNVYICLRNSHERKKWTSQKKQQWVHSFKGFVIAEKDCNFQLRYAMRVGRSHNGAKKIWSCIIKWYFVLKLFWRKAKKNCSCDWEKLLKFEAEGPIICKFFEISRAIYLNSERSEQFL